MRKICFVYLIIFVSMVNVYSQKNFAVDKIKAKKAYIEITFIGHGSLMIKYDNVVIQVDPYSKLSDYAIFPKADYILLTHHHGDHLDMKAIEKVIADKTQLVITQKCLELAPELKNAILMKNGDSKKFDALEIKAVPAYNIVNKRDNGNVFHPKGEGNGYVIEIGGKSIYIAGDTENIPEMKELKGIDIAFLPMNLPYTMTPEMVAEAAKAFKPKLLYPYHFGETDTQKLVDLLKGEKGIDLRIREMK